MLAACRLGPSPLAPEDARPWPRRISPHSRASPRLRLAVDAHAFLAVEGDEESARVRVLVEDPEDHLLLAGPGIGLDDVEVLGVDSERVVAVGTALREPGELVRRDGEVAGVVRHE